MKKIYSLALMTTVALGATATVKLPGYIGNNMVLQQNVEIKIPGETTPGAKVEVTPSWGKTVKATADAEGKFIVTLNTPKAGGPYCITFNDGDVVTVDNILSGEVWICSGQSNMEMPIAGWGQVMDFQTEIAMAHNPNVRLLQVRKNVSTVPLEEAVYNGGGWMECTPGTVPEFSACAYFYARELAAKLGVPVGVIDTTWGGTSAEAWTPYEYLEIVPGFENEKSDLKAANGDVEKMQKLNEARFDEWRKGYNTHRTDYAVDKFHGGEEGWNTMKLPNMWEAAGLPGFNGIVYMQREIEIPASWAGKKVSVKFPGIDDEDVTYFNGEEIARGWGWNSERNYTIPGNKVKAGKSIITVVITDNGGEGGIYGEASNMYLECEGERKSLVGEWAYRVSCDFSKLPPAPLSITSSNYPTVLYNAMVNPLRDFPVKGCIWYQGCNNVGRDAQYAVLFPQMVKGWRNAFNNPEMSFYFVQLAGYLAPRYCQPDSEWAALRNAQTSVLDLENTGMAVAIDLGNPVDIHPKNKQEVARRLSLLARNKTYGQDVICEAPKCVKSVVSGNKMTLTFDAPVHAQTAAALGFIIGDKNNNWQPAVAEISADGLTVVVSAEKIKKPVAVRYDWADYPNGNIYGADNLPVAPFATDK